MKKIISGPFMAVISAVVVIAGLLMPASAFADSTLKSQNVSGLNVTKHTQEEIIEYINSSNANVGDQVEFEIQPVKDTERGRLSRKSHSGAVAMLNNVRYIAGLDPVSADDGYESMAQAAAFVNMSIEKMTHYPASFTSKPEAMADSDWNDGCTGAGKSNLYSGGRSLNYYALWWTGDSDSSNIDRIGHRRWCLNPSMGRTGYGYANGYAAMYALDRTGTGTQSNVAWPAENMPIDYFGWNIPWSVSTGRNIEKSTVSIKLTRRSDGKAWAFSGSETYSPSDKKYFNVDNQGYGQSGCIIFRPDDIYAYNDGDIFDVAISENGTETICYTVRFFSLNKQESQEDDETQADDSEERKEAAKNVKTRITGVTAKKGRKAVISFEKAADVDGYQVKYSTSRNFKKATTKTRKIIQNNGSSKTVKVTIKNLKAGKAYSIKVRTYTNIINKQTGSNETVYGKWTNVKHLKAKK